MIGKYVAIAMIFIVLLSAAGALSIESGKKKYYKGETSSISGTCLEGGTIELVYKNLRNVIETKEIVCEKGEFSDSYEIGFNEPSGEWRVRVIEGKDTESTKFNVELVAESAYYLVTFLSPKDNKVAKNEEVEIQVKITNDREPVEDATVWVWDLEGIKHEMFEEGEGVYGVNYKVAHDTERLNWEVLVTASKEVDAQWFGGEGKVVLSVIPANINVTKILPEVTTIEIGEVIPLQYTVNYDNGEPLNNPEVYAMVGETRVDLIPQGQNIFTGEYYITPENLGGINIKVFAEDGAGNEGENSVSIVTFAGMIWFVKSNILYIFIAIVLAATGGYVLYRRGSSAYLLRQYNNEREKKIALMKTLQKDYYEKGTMPKEAYDKSMAEYKARVSELEKMIDTVEGKNKGKRRGVKNG